ncbi:Wadjet anti-phage system protein JetD domain-containing protein [Amycolatopsis acidicola]|uniref:Wadjet anti-phage system protein JetD domain-containing protein n=1 Tax=Amycolatopsis acidicola TaxID=2596893 RepID=UPI00140D0D9C|nr:Wadjet anti-phage system protein JetD domain-containing protein [Amycolatopsis acidicola]
MLKAAAAVDHTAAVSVHWRRRVLSALTSLAEAKMITLPRTRIDRSAEPPLPAYVTRRETLPQQGKSRRPIIWHADLGWAALGDERGEWTTTERTCLELVNAWLPRRRGVVVPIRERSLDITGDDKQLESWLFGTLFRPGRLTLELLECEPCWPPVERRIFGDGPWLVVENYTTYVSLGRRASELSFGGQLIWGAGNQVGTRLRTLAANGERPLRCWYFGDVDAGGFRIARSAWQCVAELASVDLRPAAGLYRLALEHGKRRLVRRAPRMSADTAAWAGAWLGQRLGESCLDVVRSGGRIVQENVGTEVLATTTSRTGSTRTEADGLRGNRERRSAQIHGASTGDEECDTGSDHGDQRKQVVRTRTRRHAKISCIGWEMAAASSAATAQSSPEPVCVSAAASSGVNSVVFNEPSAPPGGHDAPVLGGNAAGFLGLAELRSASTDSRAPPQAPCMPRAQRAAGTPPRALAC